MGFKRYLSWNDAIYGYSGYRTNYNYYISKQGMIIFNQIESWCHLYHIAGCQDVRHRMADAARQREIRGRDIRLPFLVFLQASVDLAGEEVVVG